MLPTGARNRLSRIFEGTRLRSNSIGYDGEASARVDDMSIARHGALSLKRPTLVGRLAGHLLVCCHLQTGTVA